MDGYLSHLPRFRYIVTAVFWLGNKIWQGLKSMWAKFRGGRDTGDAPQG